MFDTLWRSISASGGWEPEAVQDAGLSDNSHFSVMSPSADLDEVGAGDRGWTTISEISFWTR